MKAKITILFLLALFISVATKAQWITNCPPITCCGISALAVSGDTIYVNGSTNTYRSLDNGISWGSRIFIDPNSPLSANVFAINGNTIWAGTNGPSPIYKSNIKDSTWTKINYVQPGSSEGFAFAFCGRKIFASVLGYPNAIYLSNNNGSSWALINSGGFPSNTAASAFAVKDSNIIAATNSGVYRSADSGNTWLAVSGLPPISISAFVVKDSNIIAATVNGVYLSGNNGSTWSAAVNAGLPKTGVNALAVSGSTIFAGTNRHGVYMSVNNGNSWSAINTGLHKLINDTSVYSLAVNNTTIFAGTDSGVWQRPLSEVITGIHESVPPKNISIYPNPAGNGVINIDFTDQLAQIIIYNMLGEKVLEKKATKTIDVSMLPKGMYIIELSEKQNKVVNKVIIE